MPLRSHGECTSVRSTYVVLSCFRLSAGSQHALSFWPEARRAFAEQAGACWILPWMSESTDAAGSCRRTAQDELRRDRAGTPGVRRSEGGGARRVRRRGPGRVGCGGVRTAALQKTPGGILVVSQTSFRSFPSAFSPDAIAGWSLYPYALRGHHNPPRPSVSPHPRANTGASSEGRGGGVRVDGDNAAGLLRLDPVGEPHLRVAAAARAELHHRVPAPRAPPLKAR